MAKKLCLDVVAVGRPDDEKPSRVISHVGGSVCVREGAARQRTHFSLSHTTKMSIQPPGFEGMPDVDKMSDRDMAYWTGKLEDKMDVLRGESKAR